MAIASNCNPGSSYTTSMSFCIALAVRDMHMTIDEALDVTRIYSVADLLPADVPLIRNRPFRAPHHTISHAGLVGGGKYVFAHSLVGAEVRRRRFGVELAPR